MTFFTSFDLPTPDEKKYTSERLIILHLKILNCRKKIKNKILNRNNKN